MNAGDDIELTISITDPNGLAVDLYGCLFSMAIKGVYIVSYFLESDQVVIPSSTTLDWPSGTYPLQYRLIFDDGTEVFSEIENIVINNNFIGTSIVENNSFPYSFPH